MKPTKTQYIAFLIVSLVIVVALSYFTITNQIPIYVSLVVYLIIYLIIRYVGKNGIK